MSAFKDTDVPKAYAGAEPLTGAAPSVLHAAGWRDGLRAADTTLANARRVITGTMGGSASFLVQAELPPNLGQVQDFPEPNAQRLLARGRWQLTAGAALHAKILHAPSGWTQTYDHEWITQDASGRLDLVSLWTDPFGASEYVEDHVDLGAGGAEGAEPGAAWSELRHGELPLHRPSLAQDAPAEAARWSEWPDVEAALFATGGARIYHVHVAERPDRHVVAHELLDATIHGYGDHEPLEPRVELPGGLGVLEHRFGSHRGMRVARRQRERVGPCIAVWSAYAEGTAILDGGELPARVIVGDGWEGISAGPGVTGWSTGAPGWSLAGFRVRTYLDEQASPGAAVLPVRVRARVRSTGGGALRFQSSPRSFVEVEVPNLGASTWVEATGYLEAAGSGSDEWPLLVDLGRGNGPGTKLEVDAWEIAYGEFGAGE